MRQRLRCLEEEQQNQWSQIQIVLQEQLSSARAAAEVAAQTAAQRHLETSQEARETEVQKLRAQVQDEIARASDARAEAQQMCAVAEEQQRCSNANLRDAMREQLAVAQEETLEAMRHQLDSSNGQFAAELRHLQDEARQHQARLAEACGSLRQEVLSLLQDIQQLRAAQQAQEECCATARQQCEERARRVEEIERELVHLRQDDLARHVSQVPALLRRACDELPRAVPSQVSQALPAPRGRELDPAGTAQAEPQQPQDYPRAYGLLRSGDTEVLELDKLQMTVGRSPTCDVCVGQSPGVSNQHASISFSSGGAALLRDLDSRNGTFVNDLRLQGSRTLEPGDAIQFGVDGPTYVFELGAAASGRRAAAASRGEPSPESRAALPSPPRERRRTSAATSSKDRPTPRSGVASGPPRLVHIRESSRTRS